MFLIGGIRLRECIRKACPIIVGIPFSHLHNLWRSALHNRVHGKSIILYSTENDLIRGF